MACLFGAVAYALCPICGLEADSNDLDWRKKVDKFFKLHKTKNNWYLLSEYPDDVKGGKHEMSEMR